MNVKNMKLNDIIPYENNPRNNEGAVEYVANSIKQFGFKVPIVVDKNNVIVAGHTRWLAASALEMDEVPVVVADDLTPAQIKAFRLADNKTSEKASWDFTKLADEIKGIDTDINLNELGFGEFELDTLLNSADFEEDEFEELNTNVTGTISRNDNKIIISYDNDDEAKWLMNKLNIKTFTSKLSVKELMEVEE